MQKAISFSSGLYEYAPENEVLKNFYILDQKEKDYYAVRNLIDTILFETYLFSPDTSVDLQAREKDIFEKTDRERLLGVLQDNRDVFLHKTCTSLLALPGKEWAAAILGEGHALSEDIKSLSPRIAGYFLYKGQDSRDVLLEHIASGKSFKLTKKSFDYASELTEIDCILYMGIVRWQNEWWFSGVNFETPFNADLVQKERNSDQSKRQVYFLDNREKEKTEILNAQMEAFLAVNNGSPIAFMPVKDFQDFTESFIDYYNRSLKLSPDQIEASKKRSMDMDEFSENKENDNNYADVDEPGLVFFNPKSGLEMAWGINSAFPLPHNPYFEQSESDEHVMFLLVSKEMSTELVMYCIAECGSKFTFFTEKPGKDYLGDIDFLLRFWKREEYYTRPAVTLV